MRQLTIIQGVVLLCTVSACVQAAVHPVTWTFNPTPRVLNVNCGDTIRLSWAQPGSHNVYRAKTGDCPTTNLTKLKGTSSSGIYTYKVTKMDKTFWLICTVNNNEHCTKGRMNVKVVPSCK